MQYIFRSLILALYGFIAINSVAFAAAPTVQYWDTSTWATQAKQGPRPAAYLFTTSYCSTCPEAFSVLRKAVVASGQKVDLTPIFMDLDADQVRKHMAWFDGFTRMFVFDGFEPSIRQSIDPHWQNITPYIVLVDKAGKLQRVIGPPDQQQLNAWLKP